VFFNNNNITAIGPDDFGVARTAISALRLDGNFITQISPDAFQFLPDLQLLFLAFNRLTELPDGLFAHTPRIGILDLSLATE
jgi:Leucine-rich repeat (LRR) protein